MSFDMKKKYLKWFKLVVKYAIPLVLGWLEGDSHAVVTALSDLVSLVL